MVWERLESAGALYQVDPRALRSGGSGPDPDAGPLATCAPPPSGDVEMWRDTSRGSPEIVVARPTLLGRRPGQHRTDRSHL